MTKSHGAADASHAAVKSGTKSLDTKTDSSKGHESFPGHGPSPEPGSDAPDKTVSVAPTQPITLQESTTVVDLNLDSDGREITQSQLTSSPACAGDSNGEPDAIGRSLPMPSVSEDVPPSGTKVPINSKESARPETATTSGAKELVNPSQDLSGMAGSDSKPHPGDAPLARRYASHVIEGNRPAETAATEAGSTATERTPVMKAAVPPLVPLSDTVPVLLSSPSLPAIRAEGVGAVSKSTLKPSTDRTTSDMAQESAVTLRRGGEVGMSGKPASRREDASSSSSSQNGEQNTSSTATKVNEGPSSFLSVAGIQPSTATIDGKSAAVSSPRASEQSTGQGDHEAATLPGQMHAESAGGLPPLSPVHSAKLVERIGASELRLGIRAGEFGSVDIRTSMTHNQFTAQISAERGDLVRALVAELPGLHSRLAEQRVPVANVTVQNHPESHSATPEQRKPQEGHQVRSTNSGSRKEEKVVAPMVGMEGTSMASRLDIHM